MDSYKLWTKRLLLSVGACYALPAEAADITITPSIALDEKFTDNVLVTSSNRQTDFITSVNPGLKVEGKGAQLNFGLDYQPAYDHYATNNHLDGWRHEGLGVGKAELVKDWLFLDLRGAISEENANPIGPGASTDRTAPLNRLQVATYSIGPSLRHAFADQVLAQLSYRHDQVAYRNSGATAVQNTNAVDSVGDGGRFELRSGEAYSTTQGSYAVAADRVDRADMVFTHVAHTGRAEQSVTEGVALLGHLGHDRISDPKVDGDRFGGAFYGGGLHWVPGEGSDVVAEVGQRYDGLDVAALGTLKVGGATTLRLSQQTNLETEEQSLANSLDVVERDAEGRFVDPFSGLRAAPTSSPFTRSTSVFKQRRSDAALQYGDADTQAVLSTGLVTRKSISAGAGGTTSAMLATLSVDRRVREDVTASLQLGVDDIYKGSLASERGRAVKGLLGMTYAVTPMTTARASYRYVHTQPDQGANVHENMISLGGRMKF
jgi:uncharacterized protein (PEP-CTERM system associated)